MKKLSLPGLLLTLLVTALPTAAHAASLNVAPLSLQLTPPAAPTTQFNVVNTDSVASEYRVEIMAWRQVNGEDTYEPTRDVVINPARVTLQPGQRQLFRLGWKGPADLAAEKMYRVYVTQVPQATAATGVVSALRFGLPLAVSTRSVQPQVKWTAQRRGNDLLLQVTNSGTGHVRFSNLKVTANSSVADLPIPYYVLPGATRTMVLPNWEPQRREFRLTTGTATGTVDETFTLP